ncbi:MAG: alpha/beta hydrolase, partial [Planctomycetota bacterium]
WTQAELPARDPYVAVRFASPDGDAVASVIVLPALPDGKRLEYRQYVASKRWDLRHDGSLKGAGWSGRAWQRAFEDGSRFAVQLRVKGDDAAPSVALWASAAESLVRIEIFEEDWKALSADAGPIGFASSPAWAHEDQRGATTKIEVFYGTTRERVGREALHLVAWLGGYLLATVLVFLLARRPAFHRIPVWLGTAVLLLALFLFSVLDGFPLLFGASVLLFAMAPPTLRCLLRRRWHWMITATRVAFGVAALVTFTLAFTRAYQTWDQQQRVNLAYGIRRSDYGGAWGCETGICTVSIPENRDDGEIPRPLFGLPDPAEHFVVEGVEVLDEAAFRQRLAARAGRTPRKEALLFVHGYNNTFNDALFRCAQIAHDLEFPGAPVLFSWPSKGDFLRYPHDEAEVIPAGRALGRFLSGLQETDGVEHVFVIAHSMGCRILGLAMQWMRSQGHDKPFDVIVLAAPDIDEEAFRSVIAPEMRQRTERPTLYVSRNDGALKASYGFHGYRRAGDAAPSPIVVEGIDTIDVSRISADHSYIGSNFRVMSDLDRLLEGLQRAADRAELQFNTTLGYFWMDEPR